MCTAATLLTKNHYFGRNLDLEYSYEESVAITPRNYPFPFRKTDTMQQHFAMIGTAYIYDNYPLYYEATNEKGLSMAGLNFPGNADYKAEAPDKTNIAPFEFIPWVLGQCTTVFEAAALLEKTNLLNEDHSNALPLTSLHWIISDRNTSITVESVKEGINIYQNPLGVLTNNPTFDKQLFHLNNYMHLTNQEPTNCFAPDLNLKIYSRGMGTFGMPGDWSSQSRFVKAAFVKMNSVCGDLEEESVSQFFHILSSVEHPRGCVDTRNHLYEITVYSCCCNTDKGIYYYKTYDNSQITAVAMHRENLDSSRLISYAFIKEQQIKWIN
uniref:choloylglycine hydrolase n=1 Tax=Agathobacter sp. TaxID=2021311 RepID=UPI0040561B1B